jgi:hypothetical protein
MKQVTVRMPRIGHERLYQFCNRYGLSVRATFEAATIVTLNDETDPAAADLVAGMWEVARRLAASEVFTAGMRSQYPKLVVRIDRTLHARFVAACQREGLTQNASYALVVMPWPEDTPAEIVAYKQTVTPRIVEIAQALDAERRSAQIAGLLPFQASASTVS